MALWTVFVSWIGECTSSIMFFHSVVWNSFSCFVLAFSPVWMCNLKACSKYERSWWWCDGLTWNVCVWEMLHNVWRKVSSVKCFDSCVVVSLPWYLLSDFLTSIIEFWALVSWHMILLNRSEVTEGRIEPSVSKNVKEIRLVCLWCSQAGSWVSIKMQVNVFAKDKLAVTHITVFLVFAK